MESNPAYAIWAVTDDGAALGRKIQQQLPDADLYLAGFVRQADKPDSHPPARSFERLSEGLSAVFSQYRGHIFIMAAGIVVRTIAPLIRHKTVDPAVVVIDEAGRHVVSLLSGHIGGANALAQTLAQVIDATPVITTATDVHQLPAIDVIAGELGLEIENVDAVKTVHMALLAGGKVRLHDPYELLGRRLPGRFIAAAVDLVEAAPDETAAQPGIFVDDRQVDLPADILVLRPATLAAGIGCNRGTPVHEIRDHLLQVMAAHRLAPGSLMGLASIQIKQDEPGLLAAAEELGLPIRFYPPNQLERVEGIENPSAVVAKHLGVSSVCEAAAILAANRGNLIVPKRATPNVTVAIARIAFTS
jgi:cobalt-precorrin 5A hydrolase